MDEEKISLLIQDTEQRTASLETIVDNVVNSYTSSLDQIMCNVHDNIVDVDDPSTELLEKYFLELSNCLYFISSRTEKLSLYEGIAKAATQEVYNNNYLTHQRINEGMAGVKKPTVAESTAVAENESVYNSIVDSLYSTAYKIVKSKVATANTMVSTLSKMLSRRMSEYQLTNIQSGTRIVTNGYDQ